MQKRYKAAVDRLFEALRGSERDRSMNRFKEKVSTLRSTGDKRLRTERDRLYGKVRQLEQEIALLENNIGFFARRKTPRRSLPTCGRRSSGPRPRWQAAIGEGAPDRPGRTIAPDYRISDSVRFRPAARPARTPECEIRFCVKRM